MLAFSALLAVANLPAATEVTTLTDIPYFTYPNYYGFVNGNTLYAKFHTPYGIAVDGTGKFLFVADRDNNAIRELKLALNQTLTFVPNPTLQYNPLDKPVGVALDSVGNVYVLNRGNGYNGSVVKFNKFGNSLTDGATANATDLVNAAGIALDRNRNIYLTVQDNTVIQIAPNGVRTTIATIPDEGTSLQGIVVKHNGIIAVCDSGNHGVWLIDPGVPGGNPLKLTGFNGVGDYTGLNNQGATSGTAMFNQPYGVTEVGDGGLVISDFGNHRVKVVQPSGVVTNLYGVSSDFWVGPLNPGADVFPGWWDGTVTNIDVFGTVEARLPVGVVLASDGILYTTEIYYHVIRKVTGANFPPPPPPPPEAPTISAVTTNFTQVSLTWSAVAGATNYNVRRSTSSGGPYTTIASVSTTSFTDSSLISGRTYYYVISASNAGGESPYSAEVIVTTPLPPVPDPQIGWVDFPANSTPVVYTSVFHPVSSFILNNDALIVIVGAAGSQTYFTYGSTTAGVPDPTSASASAPSGYQDGLFYGQVLSYAVAQILPDLTIKAVGEKNDGSPPSAIVTTRFQFVTANPVITGDNAALFTVSDFTTNALMYYTIDGTDPTNIPSTSVFGPISMDQSMNPRPLSLNISSNITFKIRAFRDNYQPSAIVSQIFSTTNYSASKISFGFASGEASSAFVASPGQFFYAPVTLSIVPDTRIYSLQFNVTVASGGTNAGPAVAPGLVDFESFLEKPIPNSKPVVYERIPPYSFSGYLADPPPASAIRFYNGLPFVDMTFIETNNNINLIGVGWLERYIHTNLYDTTLQDLIRYSQPHDTLFLEDNGRIVLGAYAFGVPGSATDGQTYQIQIGRPSATSDGIGAPGSDVFLDTPTNGSLYAGSINAVKIVTVGQIKYLVGDAAPFRWFNAGDFGNSNLLNDDVMQVFQSAVYSNNMPPFDDKSWNGFGYTNVSDFFDSMDSCGATYVDLGHGYLEPGALVSGAGANPLFEGSDTSINSIAFGDGQLDVADVYVTFRRSLDPTLCWFRRFWTNGIRGAESLCPGAPPAPLVARAASAASVKFASADFMTSAGQTLQIPITAQIAGAYPLRVLMLNLSVNPLDGSPALASPIQFAPNPALGQPTLVDSKHAANFSGAWLDSTTSGLSSNATLGILTVTIPAGAPANAAYAVHFDHASASPNGIASFPKRTQSGLITLSDRSASTWNDGIPDSWRLRYFGSINNLLSAADADADGDGASNWQEYKAGTDPNDSASKLKLSSAKNGAAAGSVVRWPSVANKHYVLEVSPSLYGANWVPVSTNTGTGGDLEYRDSATAGPRFYRLRVEE